MHGQRAAHTTSCCCLDTCQAVMVVRRFNPLGCKLLASSYVVDIRGPLEPSGAQHAVQKRKSMPARYATQPRSEGQPSPRPGPDECWMQPPKTDAITPHFGDPRLWFPAFLPRWITRRTRCPGRHSRLLTRMPSPSFLCYPSCPRVPLCYALRPSTMHLTPGTSVLMMPKPGQKAIT